MKGWMTYLKDREDGGHRDGIWRRDLDRQFAREEDDGRR
jgi:hypothetical protein